MLVKLIQTVFKQSTDNAFDFFFLRQSVKLTRIQSMFINSDEKYFNKVKGVFLCKNESQISIDYKTNQTWTRRILNFLKKYNKLSIYFWKFPTIFETKCSFYNDVDRLILKCLCIFKV